ncbi:MAG: protein kinase [Verrucomicrobiales bacterium]
MSQGEIARGGMGVIYRVHDCELDRTLAMKRMLSAPVAEGNAIDPDRFARFMEEAHVTAKLDHPGIVPIHELGIDDSGCAWYTMKLVRGHELREVIGWARNKEHGWNLTRLIGALVSSCRAVAFAHAHGVIHRDIKPANIMVGDLGEVYVMDWGLAKQTGKPDLHDLRLDLELEREQDDDGMATVLIPHSAEDWQNSPAGYDRPMRTMDGTVIGTPAYMPPEQAAGIVDQVDHLSDIYSLGAVMYEILAQTPPYKDTGVKSPFDVISALSDGPPTEIKRIRPDAPPELVAICEKAMSREKASRYQTCLELAEDLQSYLDGRVVRAHETGAVAELKKWVLRNKATSVASVLVILSIAALAVFQTLAKRELAESFAHVEVARTDAETAKRRAEEAALKAEKSAVSEKKAKNEALIGLSASYVNMGYAEAEKHNFAEAQLWFAKGAELTADSDVQKVRAMRAFVHGRAGLRPVRMFKGRTPPDSKEGGGSEHQLAMDPGNRYLRYRMLYHLYSNDGKDPLRDEYVLLDLENEREVKLDGDPEGIIRSLDFSPRGDLMASSTRDNVVHLRDMANLEVQKAVSVESDRPITALQFNGDGSLLFVGSNPARVYDIDAGKFLPGTMPLPTPVCRAAFTADNKQVVCSKQVINLVSYNQYADTFLFNVGEENAQPIEKGLKEAVEQTDVDADEEPVIKLPDGTELRRYELDIIGKQKNVVRRLSPLPMALGRICVSKDGRMISCIGGNEGLVACYRLEDTNLWRIQQEEGDTCWPVWSADGQHILVAGRGSKELRVHQVADGKPVGKAIHPELPVQDVVFSPDGGMLTLACGDPEHPEEPFELQFWDWNTGVRMGETKRIKHMIRSIAYHPDGTWLAFLLPKASWIMAMNVATGEVTKLTPLRSAGPEDLDQIFFSHDGRWLVCRGEDNMWTVNYYDLQQKKVEGFSYGLFPRKVVVSAAGSSLFVTTEASPDYIAWLWDMNTNQAAEQVVPKMNVYPQGHLSHDGAQALIYGEGSYVAVYNLGEKPGLACPVMKVLPQNGTVMAEFVFGTPYIAVSTWLNGRSAIQIYDRVTGLPVGPATVIVQLDVTSPFWVSPDGRSLSVRTGNKEIVVVDISYLHQNPHLGLGASDFLEYAKVQACADIRDARLVAIDPLDVWAGLRERHPKPLNPER